jgi:uncharacterized protein
MGAPPSLSNREARWLAIAAQGLGRARPTGRATVRHLRSAVASVGTIQLDAINVLERTQFLVPFSRIGAFDPARLQAMSGPGGELVEYWGHAASLIPDVHQPLFRWRMEEFASAEDGTKWRRYWNDFKHEHGDYFEAILAEVRDRGPLTAGQLSDPRRQDGEWWGRRSLGRQAMEVLFAEGRLAGWRGPTFERVYDLPERVLPADVLAAPTPTVEDAHRGLLLLAATAHGVATVRDLADYYRIKSRPAAARVAELVEGGALEQVAVEGWSEPGYVVPGTRARRPSRTDAALLSPFDSLIWERARTARLFGFDYRIEVYTPAAKRTYGYYVLPMLLGDELVGRFDLKADRSGRALLVQAAHTEPGVDGGAVATAAAAELGRLAAWLGLDSVHVVGRGDLAPVLAPAVGALA